MKKESKEKHGNVEKGWKKDWETERKWMKRKAGTRKGYWNKRKHNRKQRRINWWNKKNTIGKSVNR